MNEKWTNEDILHFLNIYEKYDVLWNIHLAGYRDKNTREIALINLLEELNMEGLTVDIIRSKVKMIKTVYSQERNKILKSKIASNGHDIYKPKLAWFEKADSFLQNVTSTRATDIKKEDDQEENDNQENGTHVYEEQKKPVPKSSNKVPIKKQLLKKVPLSSKFVFKSEARKRNNIDLITVFNQLKSLTESKTKEEDEFDHFGKYIAAQLRQLPVLNALHCQEQVLSIITQERIVTIQGDMESTDSQSQWNDTQSDFE